MNLPTKLGGIGLRPQNIISKMAFAASLAACAEDTVKVIETMTPDGVDIEGPARLRDDYSYLRDFLIARAPKLKDATFQDVTDEIDELKLTILPTTLIDFLRNFTQFPVLAHKFQKRLSAFVWVQQLDDLKADSTHADRLRLASYSQPDAGRIWEMLVAPGKFLRVHSSHLQQIVRMQFGLMPAAWMYLREGPIMCPCCHKVDLKKVPSHFQHCVMLKRRPVLAKHDATCTVFYHAAQSNGVPAQWTPQLASGEATDIGFSIGGTFIHVDVTIVSPDSPSRVDGKSEKPLSAAKQAARIKVGKYDDIVSAMQENIFVPAAFETSGAFTKETGILIKMLAEAGKANMVPFAVSRAALRNRLAISIQVGNALVNFEGLNHLRSLTPAWAAAKQIRQARNAARQVKAFRRQRSLLGQRPTGER
jgi:hypothetical protein